MPFYLHILTQINIILLKLYKTTNATITWHFTFYLITTRKDSRGSGGEKRID